MFSATIHGTMEVHLTIMKQRLFFSLNRACPTLTHTHWSLGQMEAQTCVTEHFLVWLSHLKVCKCEITVIHLEL